MIEKKIHIVENPFLFYVCIERLFIQIIHIDEKQKTIRMSEWFLSAGVNCF
jgi:hypothetical protein